VTNREKDAVGSEDENPEDADMKDASDVLKRLVAIDDSSLKTVLIQQAVKRLQQPLTVRRAGQINAIIACLQKEATSVRELIESTSFWKEAVQRSQSYRNATPVT